MAAIYDEQKNYEKERETLEKLKVDLENYPDQHFAQLLIEVNRRLGRLPLF